MRKPEDHQIITNLKKRKRRLSARDGIRSKPDHYRLDVETEKAMQLAARISEVVLGLKPAKSVLIRRALRMYSEHLVALIKSKDTKYKQSFLEFLDVLQAERAELYRAACQEEA